MLKCPNCDADMVHQLPRGRVSSHYDCPSCGIGVDNPRERVGGDLFDRLQQQHRRVLKGELHRSAEIRRGWEIEDPKTHQRRLLTWIEIGAITGAI